MSESLPPVAKFSCDSECRPSEGSDSGAPDRLNEAPQPDLNSQIGFLKECYQVAVIGRTNGHMAVGRAEMVLSHLEATIRVLEILRDGAEAR